MPKVYTDEFKQSALDPIKDGMTQKQVCADLGISKSALQTWMRDARLREHGLEPSHEPEESGAQAAALKRIRELERENKIPREAAGVSLASEPQARWSSPKMMQPQVP